MRSAFLIIGSVAGVLTVASFQRNSGARAQDGTSPVATASVASVDSSRLVGAGFVEKVREAARDFRSWSRLGDKPRVAMSMCAPPPAPEPHRSVSTDEATHGKKLAFYYAKNASAYVFPKEDEPVAEGQAIVKEAWRADEHAATPTLGAKVGLFVMVKLDPKTEGTDEGWIYGCVSPAGEITAAGKIASCARCHALAKHERLYGLEH
jgi:hypothetical protein